MKSARFRSAAEGDVQQALAYYVAEASASVATQFIDELERTVRRLEAHPELGSLRFAFELDVPGLRTLRLEAFPYLVFYLVQGEALDIVRLLHTSRDVPPTLLGP